MSKIPGQLHVEQWDGARVDLLLPDSAASLGEVVIEAIAYGRYDWDWSAERETFPRRTVDPLEIARAAIVELPVAVLVLPKKPTIFGRAGWLKRSVEAAVSATDDLQPVARLMAGEGAEQRRSWRLADHLRQLVAIDTSDDELVPPAVALRAGRCGRSSWATCYAALCRQVGLEAGVVQQRDDEGLVAIVRVDEEWKLVPADPNAAPANPTPLVPASIAGQLGLLAAPPADPPTPRPEPAWSFLAHYRHPRSPHPSARTAPKGHQSEASHDEPRTGGRDAPDRPRRERVGASDEQANSEVAPELAPTAFDEPSTVSASTKADLESRMPGLFDKHPRAYSRWSDAEDDHLRTLLLMKLSVAEMSRLHGRQPGAIRSRLDKLGFQPSGDRERRPPG